MVRTCRFSPSSASAKNCSSSIQNASLNRTRSSPASSSRRRASSRAVRAPGRRPPSASSARYDVGLHLGERDRRLGQPAVSVHDRRRASPSSPGCGSPGRAGRVLDEPVAVEVAVPVDPLQGGLGRGEQLLGEREVARPPEVLSEQDHEPAASRRRSRSTACAGRCPPARARPGGSRAGSCPAARRASRSTSRPCLAARSSSASRAGRVFTISSWCEAISASRPNIVTYHGMPAASTAPVVRRACTARGGRAGSGRAAG